MDKAKQTISLASQTQIPQELRRTSQSVSLNTIAMKIFESVKILLLIQIIDKTELGEFGLKNQQN